MDEAALEKVRVQFEEELRQLNSSAKVVINFLTILAGENAAAASVVVKAIEAKLLVIYF